MESRLYGAARLSFPVFRAQAAALKVFSIGVFLGYPPSAMSSLLRKHARKTHALIVQGMCVEQKLPFDRELYSNLICGFCLFTVSGFSSGLVGGVRVGWLVAGWVGVGVVVRLWGPGPSYLVLCCHLLLFLCLVVSTPRLHVRVRGWVFILSPMQAV